jgi:hypothetical protein
MQRRHDRHGKAVQKLDDVSTGLIAEDPVFVLEGNDVKRSALRKSAASA